MITDYTFIYVIHKKDGVSCGIAADIAEIYDISAGNYATIRVDDKVYKKVLLFGDLRCRPEDYDCYYRYGIYEDQLLKFYFNDHDNRGRGLLYAYKRNTRAYDVDTAARDYGGHIMLALKNRHALKENETLSTYTHDEDALQELYNEVIAESALNSVLFNAWHNFRITTRTYFHKMRKWEG